MSLFDAYICCTGRENKEDIERDVAEGPRKSHLAVLNLYKKDESLKVMAEGEIERLDLDSSTEIEHKISN
jgi:hypothetical protein